MVMFARLCSAISIASDCSSKDHDATKICSLLFMLPLNPAGKAPTRDHGSKSQKAKEVSIKPQVNHFVSDNVSSQLQCVKVFRIIP